ncbi:MAG: CBS domain-containing protein [Actinobacteria bacterium]|nr:CBS domain-containing protein [Actinomycetota bacterium]MBM3712740.1 CBS domain-containing protein [Actinomycetota bacterium]
MEELNAKDIMTKKVITVNKDDSIEKLSELLLENKISGVPVIDNTDKVVGIVTEADIIVKDTELHFPRFFKLLDGIIYLESLNRFRDNLKKHLATKVEDIMTKKVRTISTGTPVSEIAEIMLESKINRLPVLDEKGNLVGIVTRADIVKSMISKKK